MIVALAFGVCLLGGGTASSAVSHAVSLSQLTKATFNALPGTALISFKGQEMTKSQFLAMLARDRAAFVLRLKAKADVEFAKGNQLLLLKQRASVGRLNVADKAKFANWHSKRLTLSPSNFAAIKAETDALKLKAQNATPQEQAQIEQRAAQLLAQLGH